MDQLASADFIALRWLNGDDVPPQAVKSKALRKLERMGFATLTEGREGTFKVDITPAGRAALEAGGV